jgi:dihydrofolate reductase
MKASKIKLYIATTLDGFIAREDGSLDWLHDHPNPNKTDYGYSRFMETIDTVIIGRKTYEEVLGFGVDWPYSTCTTYVITTRSDFKPNTASTSVINRIERQGLDRIRSESQKDIWLMGGGEVITSCLNLGQVDEMILFIMPVILGKGIRLFPGESLETGFELAQAESFETGVVGLTYRKK